MVVVVGACVYADAYAETLGLESTSASASVSADAFASAKTSVVAYVLAPEDLSKSVGEIGTGVGFCWTKLLSSF